MNDREQIIIIGASGHARVAIDIVQREGKYDIAGLLNHTANEQVLGYDVLGREADLPLVAKDYALKGALVAIGDNAVRAEVVARVQALCPDLPFIIAVHPSATVASNALLREGTIVMAGAVVNPGCTIDRFCILNTGSSLDHDSTMAEFASLAPRVATGGHCSIGAYSAIGIGSTLIQGIEIGVHTIIGAGSTVLEDVGSFKVAYGTPARVVRQRKMGDTYLLGRPLRQIDEGLCRSFISGKTVLVTGAAGSIGSELCQQLARYGAGKVLALDREETGLYNLGLDLQDTGCPFALIIGDVSDRERMKTVWSLYQPEIVYHCAAYKHVPMMEDCPSEAVKVNVQGLHIITALARKWGTKHFVFISTDKAVCPTGIMGATKRLGELLVLTQQKVTRNKTRFSVVRFGNILGSRGSVVPAFARAIARGGPVLVTDPQVKRFFMSVSEAVSLVIQSGHYGIGGDLFTFDMGELMNITELASKMIGQQDIEISYIGLRPGEKLAERLFCPPYESLESTPWPTIMRVRNIDESFRTAPDIDYKQLIRLARQGRDDEVRDWLMAVVQFSCLEDCIYRDAETLE